MRNLIFAGRALVQDLLPTIAFAILVAMKVDIRICTAVAIAISVGHIGFFAATKRPIAPLQWASLGLVILFGAAGILTNDARFLMAKPTLIYVIVGVVMLKRAGCCALPAADCAGARRGRDDRLRLCLGRPDVRHRRRQPGVRHLVQRRLAAVPGGLPDRLEAHPVRDPVPDRPRGRDPRAQRGQAGAARSAGGVPRRWRRAFGSAEARVRRPPPRAASGLGFSRPPPASSSR
jgi:hypothetical protein